MRQHEMLAGASQLVESTRSQPPESWYDDVRAATGMRDWPHPFFNVMHVWI
jgi:hypothetical protein